LLARARRGNGVPGQGARETAVRTAEDMTREANISTERLGGMASPHTPVTHAASAGQSMVR
jgi:hypothetical protein